MWNKKQKSTAPPTLEELAQRELADRQATHSEIPYIEGNAELGELPLAELDTFVVPARDDKGVSVPIQVRMPPYLERQIDILVASRRFPYLKAADLIRHAIVRHCHFLIDIRHSIPRHITPTLQTVLDALRDADFAIQAQAAYRHMDTTINDLMSTGNKVEAVRLYVRVRSRVQEAAECQWRNDFLAELDKKYAHLISARPMVQKSDVA